MNATSLTRILSALLLVSAVLHVITAVFGAPEALTLPLIAFGLVYGALGLWVQTGGRLAVIVDDDAGAHAVDFATFVR